MQLYQKAKLPMDYETYVFDLYGTLVDIHTMEEKREVWEKLALFYGYYEAEYTAKELQKEYGHLVRKKEEKLKSTLEKDPRYSHEASPEIVIDEVFSELYKKKGVRPSKELTLHTGQFFRVLTTERLGVYPGTKEMLRRLKKAGKRIYLLSNAQRIFTEYEMHTLGIARYFDGIMISSDYGTKKPDQRFFDLLLEKYEIHPKTTLFVGNDSKSDIAGAKQAGMDTFYVHSNISPKKDWAANATYAVKKFKSWD